MTKRPGLTRRLGRSLLLQAIYISVAAMLGVFAVSILLEDVLIKQALRGEAQFYWDRAESESSVALPKTRNMTGYRIGMEDGVPERLANLPPGFHEQESPDSITFVSEREGELLYLVFDSARVNNLVFSFGLLPLAIVLVVVYLSLYSAYRASRRAVSPVIALADKVQRLDPAAPDAALFAESATRGAMDDEVVVLSSAMEGLTNRLVRFTDRERTFTRDASHELRSPLTVIRMAAGLLKNNDSIDDVAQRNVERILKSTRDMEELTEAFLLLARESGQELSGERVCVNDIVADEVERARILASDKDIAVRFEQTHRIEVTAPPKVIASVVGNLLKNGLNYTDQGSVVVRIGEGAVVVEDTGPGMSDEQVEQVFQPFFRGERKRGGHGVGLTIVKRLSDRFDWSVDIQSELGKGTVATVFFTNSAISALSSQDLHTT